MREGEEEQLVYSVFNENELRVRVFNVLFFVWIEVFGCKVWGLPTKTKLQVR